MGLRPPKVIKTPGCLHRTATVRERTSQWPPSMGDIIAAHRATVSLTAHNVTLYV